MSTRKLAREAVIFMLVGMLLVPIVLLTYRPLAEKASIKTQQDSLRQKCATQMSVASAYEIGECTGFRDVSVEVDPAAKMMGRDAKEFQSGKSHGREVRNRTVRGENSVWAGLAIAPFGFVAGFIAWFLYRLVWFAIRG
jgi:hypothetical protein